jgi:hypothetical protein
LDVIASWETQIKKGLKSMELNYFEIEIDGRFHPVPKQEFSPYENSLGKFGYRITVWDSNIEAVKQVVSKYGVQHINASTSDLNFLKEPIFKDILGLNIIGEIRDLSPIEKLEKLEFLELLNDRKGRVDFSNLQHLKLLHCDYSNNYKNLDRLEKLDNLYLIRYPESSLKKFSNFHHLQELHLLFSNCESLNGIYSLQNLQKITLDECRKLTSIKGIEKNSTINQLIIINCKNLKDFSPAKDLSKNCLVLVDGKNIEEFEQSSKDVIENLILLLQEIGTEEPQLNKIKHELENLRNNSNLSNWRNELKKCIENLNRYDDIYTEEREILISTIGYILVDFDADEVEQIIDANRSW